MSAKSSAKAEASVNAPSSGRFPFGIARVTRFYVPQLVQAFSQSLTYPLVAGIVTHGEHGVHALTAFSQGQMIMFMIGAIGGGLVTTGLVFARTWYGYLSFRRLTGLMMTALLILQCVPAIPPFSRWIFEGIFNLPPELAAISRGTLVLGVIMNAGFFLRNVSTVVLFNNLESGKANNATLIRIAATLVCSVVFPQFGWTGPWWGLTALTFGVYIEYAVTEWYARPYIRALKETSGANVGAPPPHGEILRLTLEQFRFTLPLSLGGFLLATSPLFVAAFVSRSAGAQTMLALHYVTIGVANPVGFAALRFQQVAIKFPPEYRGDRRLLHYAITAGLILGVVPLIFATPLVGNWYFGAFQHVPVEILGTARFAIGLYAIVGVIQAVRGRIEGIAAFRKNTRAVMAGQIAYTLALITMLAVTLALGVRGWAMALSAILFAPLAAAATIYAFLANLPGGIRSRLRPSAPISRCARQPRSRFR